MQVKNKARIKLPSFLKLNNTNFKMSFSLKLALIFSTLIIILLSVFTGIMYNDQKNILESELEKRGEILAANLSSSCVNAMLVDDSTVIRYLMEGLKSEKNDVDKSMIYALIMDNEGVVKGHTDGSVKGYKLIDELTKKILKDGKASKNFLSYDMATEHMKVKKSVNIPMQEKSVLDVAVPIIGPVENLGYVRIGYSLKPINNALGELFNKIIFIVAICIIISVFTCIVVARIFTKPIDKIVAATNSLAIGDLTKDVVVRSKDEIGELAASFNTARLNLGELLKSVIIATDQVEEIGKKVSDGSSETSFISKQIAVTVDELARGFQDQVNTINKIMDTTVQLDEQFQKIATKAEGVKVASDKTVLAAQEGGKSVNLTIEKMSEINNTVNELSLVIESLGEKSIQVGEIVHLITEIADQTNLLALNAAIEAARAGEQGRGFAVVADEVRKLAEQSANASKEISKLILQIQNASVKAVKSMELNSVKVKEGTNTINMTEESLTNIIYAAQNAASMVDEISSTTLEQVKHSREVVLAMNSLVASAEQAASSTQEVSASVEEQTAKLAQIEQLTKDLEVTANDLGEKVDCFKV